MNPLIRISLCILTIFVQGTGMGQDLNGENAARTRLMNGLENNDAGAFAEASKLPIGQAAPLLLIYVNDTSTNRERAERATETLRKIPGFSGYMKQRILEKRTQPGGEYSINEFRILRAIGGDEAAAAAAPFLFVDDPPLMVANDYSAGPIRYDALNALIEMHLPDAPRGDLKEWKVWAEKKGYREVTIPPLITLEQKGIPANAITQSDAILAGSKASPTDTLPARSSGVQTQTKATSTTASAPFSSSVKSTSSIKVAIIKTSFFSSPIELLVVLVAVIAGAAAFLLRRKP